ncbi:MAG: hypothetical protein J0L93_02980 [Deltaproteobacteria bacterium]|nr:hypothetical protein [Deltaproteobacteria bacterium]
MILGVGFTSLLNSKFIRFFILWGCWLGAPSAFAFGPEVSEDASEFVTTSESLHVKSVQDFEAHVLNHKAEVKKLGILANHLLPMPLSDERVWRFLDLHDNAKLGTEPLELDPVWASRNLKGKRPLDYLYQFYNTDVSLLPTAERARAHAIVHAVNQRDYKIRQNFFLDDGLLHPDGSSTSISNDLLRIETIADLVHRGLDPIAAEEFHRKQMQRASVFLGDPEDRHIASNVERIYEAGWKLSSYLSPQLQQRCRLALDFLSRFEKK